MTNFNEYGFVEATKFEGLMPKVIEAVGATVEVEANVDGFDYEAKGYDQMAMPNFAGLMGEPATGCTETVWYK